MKKVYWIIGIVILIVIGFLFCLVFSYCSTFGCNYCGIVYIQNRPLSPAFSNTVKDVACREFLDTGCKDSSAIRVRNFDTNMNEELDSGDTLFELCKNFYGTETESQCKRVCGCP